MANRVAEYLIAFGADASDIDKVLVGVKTSVERSVADIKRTTDRLELFGTLSDNIPKVQAALDSAKAKVAQLKAEIDKVDGKAPKQLTDALKDAEKQVVSATRELNNQQRKLAELDTTLKQAGIDTKNLAAEQQRLAQASKAATQAAAEQAAKQTLGLTTMKDTEAQAAKLKTAFDTLRTSGKLSATEIAAAQSQLNTKLAELQGTVTKAGSSFSILGGVKSHILGIVQPVFTVNEAINSLIGFVNKAVDANKEFAGGLKQIGIATTATKEQLGQLGEGARALSVELGLNLSEALKGVKELVRGGIPPDNAISALRDAAVASKAALTDLGTGVQAVSVLTSAFGIPVRDLGLALDKLAVAAKNGGPTLQEFAANAGNLGVIAKATGADFDQVVAALTVMTNATGNAGEAASTLQKILQSLATDSVQKKLRDLGISATDVFDIFRQLDAKGLRLEEFFQLGIANTRAAVGVAALKDAAKDAPKLLNDLANAAGTNEKTLKELFDSSTERVKRFDAALNDVLVRLGLAGKGLGEAASKGELFLKALDRVIAAAQNFSLADLAKGPGVALAKIAAAYQDVQKETEAARQAFLRFGGDAQDQVSRAAGAADRLKAAMEAQTRETEKALGTLRTSSEELLKLIERSRSAAGDSVSEINTRANAEIEAIQRTNEARKAALLEQEASILRLQQLQAEGSEAAVAAAIQAGAALAAAVQQSEQQILNIRIKAAQDRLALIQKNEAEVSKAISAALEARIIEAGNNEKKKRDLEDEFGKLQIENTKKALSLYRQHYDDLTKLARDYIDKVKSIEGERLAFNKQISDAIRDARNETLTGAEAYAAKIQQIEEAIGRAQKARLTGNRELERTYIQEAIAGAKSLQKVNDETGKEIISAQQAQADKLTLLDTISDQYNDSLEEQETAAKRGAKATQEGLAIAQKAIDEIQKKLDGLTKTFAEGITVEINKEIKGLREAEEALNKLARDRTVKIKVQTQDGEPFNLPENVEVVGPSVPIGANQGGYIQKLAAGGFARPQWSKVPGTGNTDTVPALLQEGAFVVRKSSAQKYGDGIMSRLVKGYAAGGSVAEPGPDNARTVIAYAKSLLPFLRHAMWRDTVKTINDCIKSLVANPGNKQALTQLLGVSRNAAANFPIQDALLHSFAPGTGNKPLLSFEDFLKKLKQGGSSGLFSGTSSLFRGFAAGGAAGDTVPAMLTPGEFVISAPRAKQLGSNFLHAVNRGALSAGELLSRISLPLRFNAGGLVPGAPIPAVGAAGGGGITVNINAAGGDVENPRVIRKLMHGIRDAIRKTGK